MGDGTKFAISILMLFLSMLCFFFAFHPGGVQGVSDPQTMLKWLSTEFQQTSASQSGGTGGTSSGSLPRQAR